MSDDIARDKYREDLDLRMLRRTNQIRTKEMFEAFKAGWESSHEGQNHEFNILDDVEASLLEWFDEWLEKR